MGCQPTIRLPDACLFLARLFVNGWRRHGQREIVHLGWFCQIYFTYGPFHAAGMYTNGGQDTPMVKDGYGANAGVTYRGFSIDGFYTKENSAVNLKNIPLAGTAVLGTTCTAALGNCPNYLLGTITDNEAWDVMAKYTFDVPGFFSGSGSQHEGCSLRRSQGRAMRTASRQRSRSMVAFSMSINQTRITLNPSIMGSLQ